jgi:hypothetical protein
MRNHCRIAQHQTDGRILMRDSQVDFAAVCGTRLSCADLVAFKLAVDSLLDQVMLHLFPPARFTPSAIGVKRCNVSKGW